MIIVRTPFRISFFGGGSDYPIWYEKYGGSILNTTINKYCYITCRYLPPFLKFKYSIRYRLREDVTHLNEIIHPTVRESLKFMNMKSGVEVVHTADLPARSGIGSSSSFTVGFLHALNALNGDLITKRKLALDAIYVEQELVKENIGCQDQTAAAFGGFNRVDFGGPNKICVNPINLDLKSMKLLESNLMLFYTGLTRTASEVVGSYINTLPNKKEELNTMHQLVDEAILLLQKKDFDSFGKLLHEGWETKKCISKVISNNIIDNIYNSALKAGALGGKICGAGSGGFLLLYVPKKKQQKVKEKLKKLLHVPFLFDFLGSQLILYNVQNEYF